MMSIALLSTLVRGRKSGTRIICMHSVKSGDHRAFRQRMEWLKRNYRIWPVRYCLSNSPNGVVVGLSFDDGDESWFDVVLPVLKKLNLPATFFVNSESYAERIRRDEKHFLWDVGGHTRGHINLGGIFDNRELEKQIEPRVLFAYPYGRPKDYNQATIEYLENHGVVEYAFTCVPGWFMGFEGCRDYYELPRDSLDYRDPEWFWRARLKGSYDWLYKRLHKRSWK